jgi:arsenite methyltransferase
MTSSQTLADVKEYYGKVLKSNQDLQTSACCTAETFPHHLREILQEMHPEVVEKFYGCGSPLPPALTGKTVLDLGCGTGRDCFILSKLVGPQGRVIGVDMTAEQLAVAQKHCSYHMKKFGFLQPNVEFHQGYIEDLASMGIENNSVDVVVSNCVLNLSPDKRRVFSEIFRVLKPGGELYFSDVFAGRRIPEDLTKDPVLRGECLGGALYKEDFRRLLMELGCQDYRIVNQAPLTLNNPDIQKKAGMIDFYSLTIRAFKIKIEDRCEDYGQVAYYLGTIAEHPHFFILDDHHKFEKGRPLRVCSNTAAMLSESRYASHFKIEGDLSTHYGLFPCAPEGESSNEVLGGSCC